MRSRPANTTCNRNRRYRCMPGEYALRALQSVQTLLNAVQRSHCVRV